MGGEKMCRRKIKCQHIDNPWILDHGMMSWAQYSYHVITVSYHSYHDSHVWCMEWSVSEHQIFLQQRHVNKIPARILSSVKWFIRPFTEVMLQYYESLIIKWTCPLIFLHSAWSAGDWHRGKWRIPTCTHANGTRVQNIFVYSRMNTFLRHYTCL